MSRHRPHDVPPAETLVEQPVGEDDLRGLARQASAGLTATAQAADERLDEVAETAARNARRGLLLALIAVSVVLLASIALNLYTLQASQDSSRQIAELSAGSAFDSNLDSTRQTNLQTARRHLIEVNDARRAAGLVPIPDPGLRASSAEVDGAWTLGLSDLLTIGTLQEKGLAVPGVNAPRPNSGTFPWLRVPR